MKESLIQVDSLVRSFVLENSPFKKNKKYFNAVNDVTFQLYQNETVGLVGESGCGKSTIGSLLTGLIPTTTGDIYYRAKKMKDFTPDDWKTFRMDIQIVFQDPFASLDPLMTLGAIIEEPLKVHNLYKSQSEKQEKIRDLFAKVGLSPDYLNHYPHELSGGQRQRIAIARSLASNPSILIADEPTSALDVSIKAQIVNLLSNLRQKSNFSMIFISHDLSMIKHICNRVLVMYLGKIVESGNTHDIFENPQHPYTQLLLESIPIPDPEKRKKRASVSLELGDTTMIVEGCSFAPRCPGKSEICMKVKPVLQQMKNGLVACHNPIGG